jgi:hypothetical protein
MSYPQANQEMTVGAFKEMTDHIEKQSRFPFHKRMSTLDGAFRYAKFAMKTYSNAKVTVEPIDEGIWKYRITVDEVVEPQKLTDEEYRMLGKSRDEPLMFIPPEDILNDTDIRPGY